MDALRELMSFESFWTIWFWIAHVVTWSMASHFTMGVPYDMIQEANREKSANGPWAAATEALILAQVFRFASVARRHGAVLTGATAFLLSVIVTLGWLGDLELARAIGTILVPLAMIYALTVRTATRIDETGPRGRELRDAIKRQRLWNQLIGLLGIAAAVALAVWDIARFMTPWGF